MTLNWPKFLTLFVIILSATVLAALKVIDGSVWLGVVGPFSGYIVGNGSSAYKGQVAQPVIVPKTKDKI